MTCAETSSSRIACPSGILVLERERRRLPSPAHRERLAKSVDELAAVAVRPLSRVPASRPYFNVSRRASARRRAARSRFPPTNATTPNVRGVALAERLLTFPGSPLWAADSKTLAEELARISYLLVQAR